MKKYIASKYLGILLSMILIFSQETLNISALAQESDNEAGTQSIVEIPLTEDELAEIENDNEIISAYYAAKQRLRGTTTKVLSVTPVQQINTYYCGPASALMVANFLNLKTTSNTAYTQSTIAQRIGTTSAGSSSSDITTGLNNILSENSMSMRYQRTTLSSAPIDTSIVYSIDHNVPLIVSVKNMPDYTSSSGHFIVVYGYSQNVSLNVVTTVIYYIDPHYNSSYYGQKTMALSQMNTACSSNGEYYIRLKP
jgi:hypothetical protein